MVSTDDVRMAYRLILGREPENETVLRDAANACGTLDDLRGAFLNSAEFRGKLEGDISGPTRWSGMEPPMEVEDRVDEATLARLLERVGLCWTGLAEVEPHWAVLTNDNFTRSNIAAHQDAFYASGRNDVDRLAAFLARSSLSLPADARCLEIGCGVGRVTGWLAGRVGHVTAVDIAPPMLRLAGEHLDRLGVGNVSLAHLDSIARLGTLGAFDILFSVLVIQHNPPPVMGHLLRTALDTLAPGGIAYFQLPTYAPDYRFRAADYLAQDPRSHKMEMHALPQHTVFALLEEAGLRVLEVAEDELVGNRLWRSNTILARKST